MSQLPAASYGTRQAMPLDRMFLEGLGIPVEEPSHSQPAEKSEYEKACLCAASLSQDAEFMRLLEYLVDRTLRRPTFQVELGDQAALHAAKRVGQNDAVATIIQMIAHGRGEQIPNFQS